MTRLTGLRPGGCESLWSGFVASLAKNSTQRNIPTWEATHSLQKPADFEFHSRPFPRQSNDGRNLYFQRVHIILMRLDVCAFKGQHSSCDNWTKQQNTVKSLQGIRLHSQVGCAPLEWEMVTSKGTGTGKEYSSSECPTYICLFCMKVYFTLMDKRAL